LLSGLERVPAGALLCLALAALCATTALVPRWRKGWGWGRGGSAGPISAVGWAGIVAAFLLFAAAIASEPMGWVSDPFFSLLMLLGGFAVFVAAGVVDSVRNEQGRKKPPRGPGNRR